jgi:RNA ligase (TIGR02306 family)
VLEILPIKGADVIELVKINGWQCVTKKNEFKIGELGVFLEIDSIPPDEPLFSFLWTPKNVGSKSESFTRPDKFRIRTMKLRGVLSQGLFLPLRAFGLDQVVEGQDLTEVLGIVKYEVPIAAIVGGVAQGPFPSFVPKTDELRVQSAPQVLDEIRGLPYAITLKYDGTSATFCVHPSDGEFHACSRNYSVHKGKNVYWQIAQRLQIESKLREFYPYLALQGEICGPGIQKNHLEIKQTEFFVFNIYDFKEGRYLNHDEARQILEKLELKAVETLERGESFNYDLDRLLESAQGKYPNTKNEREGIVIRPLIETTSEVLAGRLSFKAISNQFLLKES